MEIDDRLLKALSTAWGDFCHDFNGKLGAIRSELQLAKLKDIPVDAEFIDKKILQVVEFRKKFEIELNNTLLNRTYMLLDEPGESNSG